MVCSSRSYSKTNRSFSSITLLAFHGMRSVVSRAATNRSVRNAPGLICQVSARSVPPPPPLPPLSFWIMGVDGNSRKIFEFKGVKGKIFINQQVTGVFLVCGRLFSYQRAIREPIRDDFETHFGSRKSTFTA